MRASPFQPGGKSFDLPPFGGAWAETCDPATVKTAMVRSSIYWIASDGVPMTSGGLSVLRIPDPRVDRRPGVAVMGRRFWPLGISDPQSIKKIWVYKISVNIF